MMETGYMYEKGMKALEEAMDKEDWVEKVQVVLENEYMKGTYGPGLESVRLDLEEKQIIIDDRFSEVAATLGEMTCIDYDESMEIWTYCWSNGVAVYLYM